MLGAMSHQDQGFALFSWKMIGIKICNSVQILLRMQ